MKLKNMAMIFGLVLAMSSLPALAGSPRECKGKVEAARKSLLELKGGKKDQAQQGVVKQTAEDASACITSLSGNQKVKDLWGKFYSNRVEKLVPAILKDDQKTIEDVGSENANFYSQIMQILRGE